MDASGASPSDDEAPVFVISVAAQLAGHAPADPAPVRPARARSPPADRGAAAATPPATSPVLREVQRLSQDEASASPASSASSSLRTRSRRCSPGRELTAGARGPRFPPARSPRSGATPWRPGPYDPDRRSSRPLAPGIAGSSGILRSRSKIPEQTQTAMSHRHRRTPGSPHGPSAHHPEPGGLSAAARAPRPPATRTSSRPTCCSPCSAQADGTPAAAPGAASTAAAARRRAGGARRCRPPAAPR